MKRIKDSESSLDVLFLESCEPKSFHNLKAKCERINFGSLRRSHRRFGQGLGVARIETSGRCAGFKLFPPLFILSVANPRMVRFRMGDVVLLPC